MEHLKKTYYYLYYFLMEQFIEPLEKSLHMCILYYLIRRYSL